MVPGAGRLTGVGSREGFESLSAEHKRPLYAFGAVTALCTFLLLSAIVRGDALSVAFHAAVPISAQADAAPAEATVAPEAEPTAAAELPQELTPQSISRVVVRAGSDSSPQRSRGKDRAESATAAPATTFQADNAVTDASVRGEQKAQERAQQKAERAEAKAVRKAEHAATKAQREAERAAAKVQREAEKAAAKVQREAEKAAAKAQREAEKAQRQAETTASEVLGHPGLGAGKAAGHAHKH